MTADEFRTALARRDREPSLPRLWKPMDLAPRDGACIRLTDYISVTGGGWIDDEWRNEHGKINFHTKARGWCADETCDLPDFLSGSVVGILTALQGPSPKLPLSGLLRVPYTAELQELERRGGVPIGLRFLDADGKAWRRVAVNYLVGECWRSRWWAWPDSL